MKRGIAGLVFIALCLGSLAGDGSHVFTDTQGRVIELKVIKCDFKHGTVLVERMDGRRVNVNISDFCSGDREYLKEWFMANELLSEDSLKIVCDDKVMEKRKENVRATQASSTGGTIREVEIGECRYEKIAYEIEFENNTQQPIENAHIEYRIYYDQTKRGVDLEPEKMVFLGAADLPTMGPRKSSVFITQPVEIYNDNISAQNIVTIDADGTQKSGVLDPAEGEVRGLRGRLTVTLASGETIVREFHHPSSLSKNKYPWTESSDS